MSAELVPKEESTEIVQTGNVLQALARIATDPNVNVEKLERILAMQERLLVEQARQSFFASLARVTPELPEITQRGVVKFEGKDGRQGQDRKFAKLEDIDRVIRPIIAKQGFSQSFNTGTGDGGKIRVILRVSHRDGHFETLQIDLPHDSSGSKNGAQAVASTIAYGRRILTKMYWNLMEAGEDIDGNDPTAISDDEAGDIEAMLQEVKGDRAGFLKYMGVESIGAILKRDHKKAIESLQAKRRSMNK